MSEQGVMYPIIDPVKWGRIHDVKIISKKCNNCGKRKVANTPFAIHGWRGFESAEYCGESGIFSMVRSDPERRRQDKEYFQLLKAVLQ